MFSETHLERGVAMTTGAPHLEEKKKRARHRGDGRWPVWRFEDNGALPSDGGERKCGQKWKLVMYGCVSSSKRTRKKKQKREKLSPSLWIMHARPSINKTRRCWMQGPQVNRRWFFVPRKTLFVSPTEIGMGKKWHLCTLGSHVRWQVYLHTERQRKTIYNRVVLKGIFSSATFNSVFTNLGRSYRRSWRAGGTSCTASTVWTASAWRRDPGARHQVAAKISKQTKSAWKRRPS